MKRFHSIAIAWLLTMPLFGAPAVPDDALVRLCEVWSTVKFLDPQLMLREVDWDGALVRAIPRVREAQTRDDFANAVASMLDELHDPVTHVVRKAERAKPQLFDWDDDVLIVNIGPYADSVPDEQLFTVEGEIAPELAKAKNVVFDLRTRGAETPGWILDNLPLVRERVAVPARRYAVHSGYAPQSGTS